MQELEAAKNEKIIWRKIMSNEEIETKLAEKMKKQLCPLLAIRTEKGLTQTRLAELSGINARQIRKIETGEIKVMNVTVGTMSALANALGVKIEDLLGGA